MDDKAFKSHLNPAELDSLIMIINYKKRLIYAFHPEIVACPNFLLNKK